MTNYRRRAGLGARGAVPAVGLTATVAPPQNAAQPDQSGESNQYAHRGLGHRGQLRTEIESCIRIGPEESLVGVQGLVELEYVGERVIAGGMARRTEQ